jgi:hypothetical protein
MRSLFFAAVAALSLGAAGVSIYAVSTVSFESGVNRLLQTGAY